MGVVLFEMLFGYCPFQDITIERLINQIDNSPMKIPLHKNNISEKTAELLRKMLVTNPKKRIKFTELAIYL